MKGNWWLELVAITYFPLHNNFEYEKDYQHR
jgi:hypothetical protein